LKEKISRIINSTNPKGKEILLSEIYFTFTLFLIFLTPIILYIEFVLTKIYQSYFFTISTIDYAILTFFTLDLILRIYVSEDKKNYLKGFDGLADIFAVVPEILLMIIGVNGSSTWLRIVKLLRYLKILNVLKGGFFFTGFTRTMVLTSTAVMSIKIIILILEADGFIPKFENISIVLGLVSFSLAMLLGTKLSVVNKRLYDIEDAINRIVAGIKVFWFTHEQYRPYLHTWIQCFEENLRNPSKESVSRMREENNSLYSEIGKIGINPNFVGFSRDAAFILNKSISKVNPFYEKFLFIITIVFTIVVLITIPGITGLVAAFVISFIFFGVYHLVGDMDSPLDYGENSIIKVDLSPIDDLKEDLKIN
tara:strand:+ start:343 stop:1440 length:1098 start_codon:yes stop_codon:yes gene_type:complete